MNPTQNIDALQQRAVRAESALRKIRTIAGTEFPNLDDLSDAILLIKDTAKDALDESAPRLVVLTEEQQQRVNEIALALLGDEDLLFELNLRSEIANVERDEAAIIRAKLEQWQDGGGK